MVFKSATQSCHVSSEFGMFVSGQKSQTLFNPISKSKPLIAVYSIVHVSLSYLITDT